MLSVPQPWLRWSRGVLRPWRHDDASTLVVAWNDPDVARYNQVPSAPSLEIAQRWIAGNDARLEADLSVDLVIEDNARGCVIGEVGLSDFDRRRRTAAIGYWLLPGARGGGAAQEAVRAIVDWAASEFELDAILARCDVDNLASQRVAARVGFELNRTDPDGHQVWLWRWIDLSRRAVDLRGDGWSREMSEMSPSVRPAGASFGS